MNGAVRIVTVTDDEDGIRLDRWFKRHFPGLGHGRLEKLLRTGQIRLDGGRAKASTRIEGGQSIRLPPGVEDPPPGAERARDIAAADARFIQDLVLYQDDDVIAINKPSGLAVQGGTKVARSVDGLLDGLRFDAPDRPRLVHRLDKDTSGVLALARSRKSAAALVGAFRDAAAEKTYWALVAGVPSHDAGVIDLPLTKKPVSPGREQVVGDAAGGRWARTRFRVLARAGKVAAWLALVPETGRTHQIRAHCQALGTPILGDRKYGGAGDAAISGSPKVNRLMLHARSLVLPGLSGGRIALTAPIDRDMHKQLDFWGFEQPSGDDIESFTADPA